MRSRLLWIILALLIWACTPGRASAHLVNSGMGPFYDGIAHLFLTPVDVLVVIAVSLLAGLGGPAYGRWNLFVLPAAWLTGAIAGRITDFSPGLPALSAALLITLGVLVAADRRLPLAIFASLAAACGLIQGTYNGSSLPPAGGSFVAVAGIICAVFVVAAVLAGQVVSLRVSWARIVVRVAGSWIGAIGLFMLGWATR